VSMISKRGELTTKEILEIILAVAVVLVMAFLLYKLISPSFNVVDETAKSYFESFEKVIEDGGGSFSMWQAEEEGKEFYLVYFQNRTSFKMRRSFYSLGENVNHVCVCYWEGGDAKCESCGNLDMPLVKDDKFWEPWVVVVGEEIEIVDKGEYYNVAVK